MDSSKTNEKPNSSVSPTTINVPSSTPTDEKNKKDSPNPKKERPPMVRYRELFRYATPLDIFLTYLGVIFACGTGVIFPVFSIIFGGLLNLFNSANFIEEIDKYASYFLAIAVASAVGTFFQITFPLIAAERQARRIREEYMKALLRQNIGWHDTNPTGEVASRLAEDTILILGGIGDKLSMTFQSFVTFFVGMGIGFSKSWALTLTMIAATPVLIILVGFLKVATQRFETDAANAYAKAGEAASQVFSNIKTVTAFGGELAEIYKYDKHLEAAEKAGIRKGSIMAMVVGLMFSIIYSLYAVAMYVGSRLILNSRADNPICRLNPLGDGCFSGGNVIQVFMVVLISAFSIGGAGPNFASFASAQAAAYKMFKTIDTVPPIDTLNDKGIKINPKEVKGKIEFKNITFAYPSRPTEIILKNFNLVIEPGQTVALVGESGSGKSTLTALLQRFYDPIEGTVTLDGIDIKEYNILSLRECMGYVQQDPLLFGISIKENIAQGKQIGSPATDEEIINSAKAANAHDFIARLPNGYDTIVGTSVASAQLSGGQRQRVCIARAIIRDPSILLLDEATSALDTESEKIVQESIDKLLSEDNKKSRTRTTIIIAHRLSTITNADNIVVLQKGIIIEQGNHTELINKENGMYRHLRSLQDVAKMTIHSNGRRRSSVDPNIVVPPSLATETNTLSTIPHKDTTTKSADEPVMMTNPLHKGKDKDDKKSDATKGTEEFIDNFPPVKISRVWKLQAENWFLITVALLGAGASGCAQPAFAIVYSSLISVLFDPRDDVLSTSVAEYAGYFMAFAAGIFLATWIRIACFTYLGEKLTRKLRTMAYQAMLRQEIGWFDRPENSAGRLNSRLSSDAALIRGATGESLSQLFQFFGAIIAAFAIAFSASWRLALICCSLIPFLIIGQLMHGHMFKGFQQGSKKALEEVGHIATESMSSIRLVNSYNLQSSILKSFVQALNKPMKDGYNKALVAGVSQAYSGFIMFGSYSVAFYAGGRFIVDGLLDFTSLMRVFLAVTMASQAAGSALSWGPDRSKALLSVRAIFAIIDRKSTIDPLPDYASDEPVDLVTLKKRQKEMFERNDKDNTIINIPSENGETVSSKQGRIEFKNITFAYPSRPDVPVLEKFNLVIEPGQTVALVGESGSGKSTIVSLLERFYDPSDGTILIDGIPLSSIRVPALRNRISLVQQEPVLFADSIGYNIGYGRTHDKVEPDEGVAVGEEEKENKDKDTDTTPKSKKTKTLEPENIKIPLFSTVENVPTDIIQAAKDANAHSFITQFKNTYATYCGNRGTQLSGGQKQRIAIARAIIRDPSILLLDEATSALDTHSEAVVQAALDRLLQVSKDTTTDNTNGENTPINTKSRTTIIIAHRLSTIKNADVIVVMQKGKIVEVGNHDDLMMKNQGYYRKLALAQDSSNVKQL